jgi:hypothetical protein
MPLSLTSVHYTPEGYMVYCQARTGGRKATMVWLLRRAGTRSQQARSPARWRAGRPGAWPGRDAVGKVQTPDLRH